MRGTLQAALLATLIGLPCAAGAAGEGAPQPPALSDTHQSVLQDMVGKAQANMNRIDRANLMELAEEFKRTVERRLAEPETLGAGVNIPRPDETPEQDRYTVLISRSLTPEAVKEILHEAAAHPGTRLALRGVAEDETLGDGARAIQALIQHATDGGSVEAVPPVLLDPRPYRRYGVTVVPTIVHEAADGQVTVARGTTSFDVFERERERQAAQRGDDGFLDLGQLGPTKEIEELDLIEVMQARAAAIDWRAKKEDALRTYWQKVTLYPLPKAQKERVRRIDPTVLVTRDMATPDGQVFAHAGQKINPLALRPFTGRLVIFDGTDPAQVEIAAAEARKAPARGDGAVLMVTSMDREAGWDGLRKLQDRLQAAVYLLQPEIRDRFKIERVPAVVSADETHFIVTEIPPED